MGDLPFELKFTALTLLDLQASVSAATYDPVVDAISFGVVIDGQSVATFTKAKQNAYVAGLEKAVPGAMLLSGQLHVMGVGPHAQWSANAKDKCIHFQVPPF